MQIDEKNLASIIQTIVDTTIKGLVDRGLLGNKRSASSKSASASSELKVPKEKSAYSQTEALLFNYRNFQKLLREKEREIEEIRQYGVLENGSAIKQYNGNGGYRPLGIILEEERIEREVKKIEDSMEKVREAISLVDKAMESVKFDPYYKILEMRYFEGRTQEDIAVEFNCTQPNINYHKRRLIQEISINLFPDKVVAEYLS